jgi:hypothetical protein
MLFVVCDYEFRQLTSRRDAMFLSSALADEMLVAKEYKNESRAFRYAM